MTYLESDLRPTVEREAGKSKGRRLSEDGFATGSLTVKVGESQKHKLHHGYIPEARGQHFVTLCQSNLGGQFIQQVTTMRH